MSEVITKLEKPYITIRKDSEVRFVEKKSEFIGRAFYVENEEACTNILSKIRKQHYDATHNCFGYILGRSFDIQRSSDDGEPSGTAGLPILEVLRKGHVTNTLIVVTRYFGGILLGSGGLIRAYSQSAGDAIRESGLVRIAPSIVYGLHIEYSYLEKMKYELGKQGFTILDIEFSEIARIKITSPENSAGNPAALLSEITGGTGIQEILGIEEVKIPLNV